MKSSILLVTFPTIFSNVSKYRIRYVFYKSLFSGSTFTLLMLHSFKVQHNLPVFPVKEGKDAFSSLPQLPGRLPTASAMSQVQVNVPFD